MNLKKLLGIDNLSAMNIQAACGCSTGKKRRNNEDNFYFNGSYMNSDNNGLQSVESKVLPLDKNGFFCVFDGMGGGDFGEVASYTAAKKTKEFLDDEVNINPYDITPSLTKMCEVVNRAVYEAGEKLGSSQMGSTLVGLFFHAEQAWVCNMGDSRCYILRNGSMKQISEDHTDEGFMKENGITGRKPYLTQYLGIDPDEMQIVPSIKNIALHQGDRFLICSDGVTDMVEEQVICNILARSEYPDECVETLIRAALDGGGKDNITAIVLDVI